MRVLSVLFVVIFVLTGCDNSSGSGGTSDASGGLVRQIGIIDATDHIILSTDEGESDIAGFFITLETGIPFADLQQEVYPELDTCLVQSETDPPLADPGMIDILGITGSLVSAGEVLTVSSSGGSFAELIIPPTATSPFYISNRVLTFPLPSGLSIDIPGDEFPAYTGIPIPQVNWLFDAQPDESSIITPDTQFSWTAGNDPDARIVLTTVGVNTSDDLSGLDFVCHVIDDGFFEFPDITKAQLGADFMSNELDMYREKRQIVRQGETMLLLTHDWD